MPSPCKPGYGGEDRGGGHGAMSRTYRGYSGIRALRAPTFLVAVFCFSFALFIPTSHAENRSRGRSIGQLEVIALPEGSKVLVDDELVGESPLGSPLDLPVGEHKVLVHKRGFARHTEDVVVSVGQLTTVEAYLPPISGILRVTSNVRDAEVSLDGESLGSAPIDLEVEPGEQILAVTAPGYEDFNQSIEVVAGEAISIDAVFEERRASINHGWFWGTSALTVVLFVTGMVTGSTVLTLESEFDDARARYEAGDLTAVYDGADIAQEYDRYRMATSVLLVMAASLAVTSVVLAILTWRRRGRREDARSRENPGATVGENALFPAGSRPD